MSLKPHLPRNPFTSFSCPPSPPPPPRPRYLELIEAEGEVQDFCKLLGQGLLSLQVLGGGIGGAGQGLQQAPQGVLWGGQTKGRSVPVCHLGGWPSATRGAKEARGKAHHLPPGQERKGLFVPSTAGEEAPAAKKRKPQERGRGSGGPVLPRKGIRKNNCFEREN